MTNILKISPHSVAGNDLSQLDERTLAKLQRLTEERHRILNALENDKPEALRTLRYRAAYILNSIPESRDSDIRLAIHIYRRFFPHFIDSETRVCLSNYLSDRKIDRIYDIQRIRAHIQNDLGLFRASAEVGQERARRSSVFRDWFSAEVAPERIVYSFLDESCGKECTVVGGLFIYNDAARAALADAVSAIRARYAFNNELKWSAINQQKLEAYEQIISLLHERRDVLSLKAYAVDNDLLQKEWRGVSDKILLAHLYFFAFKDGLSADLQSRRVALPLAYQAAKDEGQFLPHQLARLTASLDVSMKVQFGRGVQVGPITEASSRDEGLIQLSDFVVGAIRYAREPGGKKDEYRDHLVSFLSRAFETDLRRPSALDAFAVRDVRAHDLLALSTGDRMFAAALAPQSPKSGRRGN